MNTRWLSIGEGSRPPRKTPPFSPVLPWIFLLATGCGGGGSPALEFPAVTPKLPDLSQAGLVKGRVTLEGKAPKLVEVVMADAWCRASHGGKAVKDDILVDEATGGLKDVLIHVTKGLEGYVFDHERKEAVLDQLNCVYVPHVLAVQTYQPVRFKSSDDTPHNVNTQKSAKGQGFNESFANSKATKLWQFKKPELSLQSICNIHPWMRAYIHVLEHPYFVVTDKAGNFSLGKLPPGRYTLEAVHPEMKVSSGEVEIPAKGEATLDFILKRK